jgi:uncharacterized membrane protein
MTKNEFIDGLKTALTGELPDTEITANIRFYEDYIKSKRNNDEEEIVGQLGDPRLIAKTIIETYQISHGPLYNGSKHDSAYQDTQTSDGNSYRDYKSNHANESNDYGRNLKFNINSPIAWYQKLFITFIVVIFILLLLIVGGILLRLFFTIGIPLLIIYFGYKLVTNNMRR